METGRADTHGGTDRQPERQPQPERGRWADRTGTAPADRQSHAEPPKMPQRVQLPPQTQTERRSAQRAAQHPPIPISICMHHHRHSGKALNTQRFTAPAKIFRKFEKRG